MRSAGSAEPARDRASSGRVSDLLRDQRHLFDMSNEVAHVNTANLSPLSYRVAAAGERAIGQRARPWSFTPPDWCSSVQQLRDRADEVLGTAPTASP